MDDFVTIFKERQVLKEKTYDCQIIET